MGNCLCAEGIAARGIDAAAAHELLSELPQTVRGVWQDPEPKEARPCRVVRPNGTVDVFHRSVTAGEILDQLPTHAVFPYKAPFTALGLDQELEEGRLYVVLPADTFLRKKRCQAPIASTPTKTAEGVQAFSGPRVPGDAWKPKLETIEERVQVHEDDGQRVDNNLSDFNF